MFNTYLQEIEARAILREAAQDLARERGQQGPVRPRYRVGTLRDEQAAVELLLSQFPPEWRQLRRYSHALARAIVTTQEPETPAEQPQAISVGPMPVQTATRRRVVA
ncbi:MAG: hypothetical protein SFX18_19920 [Pirellulales bacterium]|nr:hypothetical protein [Pirellulales bacterium]